MDQFDFEKSELREEEEVTREIRIAQLANIFYCKQCGQDMGNEWILGPVCGACCRKNHKKAIGKK